MTMIMITESKTDIIVVFMFSPSESGHQHYSRDPDAVIALLILVTLGLSEMLRSGH